MLAAKTRGVMVAACLYGDLLNRLEGFSMLRLVKNCLIRMQCFNPWTAGRQQES